ncbi:MAG: cellulase [Calditrichaeota bacterium]|nr:MAG: cellulase [Calditrichota bacterium]
MKAVRRIFLSLVALAVALFILFFLTNVGSRMRGPLQELLNGVGSGVRALESWAYHLVRGPGREAQLRWFDPYRTHLDWLRKPDVLLLGAYDDELPASLEGIRRLEEALGTRFPLIHFYTAWGDRADQQFPRAVVEAIWDYGSVPVITWEPWLTAFQPDLHPELPPLAVRDRRGMAQVAAGVYDFYLRQWAREAARFGRPLFVRLAHEMNDPYRYPWGPQNNTPESFVAAWQHVVQLFREQGATNVLWVWSPHPAYGNFSAYYPGDAFVDWVGGGALNYGTVAYWSRWWSFQEIFGQHYPEYAAFGKPIMITEFNSLAVGGNRAEWFARALNHLPKRFPQVRALLFFHSGYDPTVTYKPLDWSIPGDSLTVQAIRQAIRPWDPAQKIILIGSGAGASDGQDGKRP